MSRIYAIRATFTPGRPSKPLRDSHYLAYVRKLGYCLACGSTRGIEAAHTGPHGIGQKAGDDTAINLCHKCHRTANDALHKIGPARFAEVHGLDIPAHIARIRAFYLAKIERRAA